MSDESNYIPLRQKELTSLCFRQAWRKLRFVPFFFLFHRRPATLGSAVGIGSERKTAYPLLPSSFPNRTRYAGLRFGGREHCGESCRYIPLFFLSKLKPLRWASILFGRDSFPSWKAEIRLRKSAGVVRSACLLPPRRRCPHGKPRSVWGRGEKIRYYCKPILRVKKFAQSLKHYKMYKLLQKLSKNAKFFPLYK